LRPGITWSDGTAITAEDVVWSWQRLIDPKTASPYASYPGNMHIVNAADIAQEKSARYAGRKAINDTTLEVTLTQPNAAFLAMLAHPSLVPVDKVLIGRLAISGPSRSISSAAGRISCRSGWSTNASWRAQPALLG
jgi:oligopeptide transport system substrate-binding protein